MAPAADTSPEADAAQLAAYRRMTGAERLQVAFRLTALSRRATETGIRRRHPEYGDEDVRRALVRLLHGDDVARRVWPGRGLLEP